MAFNSPSNPNHSDSMIPWCGTLDQSMISTAGIIYNTEQFLGSLGHTSVLDQLSQGEIQPHPGQNHLC